MKKVKLMEEAHAQRGQIFKNPFLEALTRTTPFVTFTTYGSVVLLFLFLSYRENALTVVSTIGLYIIGLAFWTFFEYLMHRYLFHLVSDSEAAKRFTYAMHGVHHEEPRDHDRLFMPPVPGLIIIGVVAFGVKLLLGIYAFAFLAGWLNGYLIYAFIHYKVHGQQPPKMFRRLWVHHNMHHYRYHDKAFGVSTMLWDRIFGTMPPDPNSARNDKTEKQGGAPMYVIHSKAD